MKKLTKSLLGHKSFFIVAFIYTILISVGSLINTGNLPKIGYQVSDKTIHFFGYFFFLIFWFFYALLKHQKTGYFKLLLITACISFIYGIIIEVLQGVLSATRQADLFDVLANGMGVLTALILLKLLQNKIINLKSKN
jgi:VanZ family protein